MDRVERLLKMGYFPSQLPPCFTTRDLANSYKAVYSAWIPLLAERNGIPLPKSPETKAEIFSVARVDHRRRLTCIPNPISQTFISMRVIDHWGSFVSLYRKSKISASRPRFLPKGNRATSIHPMRILYDKKITASAGYRFMLRSDISRFFPTIYTHSVPWAFHTKSKAKRNRKPTKKWFGNFIDLDLRQCQDGQTMGIPIGPDTSHMIAEAVATAVDIEFHREFGSWPAGFRYVDDYYLFFETAKDADRGLSALVSALQTFELHINYEKTFTSRVIEITDDFWKHRLQSFEISPKGRRHIPDINHFFELAKDLARTNSDESVMLYALKKISSTLIRKESWDFFESHVCHIAMAYPNTLQTVARIFSSYQRVGYPLNNTRISLLINSIIEDHAPLGHHSEVAWCLWMVKDLKLSLTKYNVDLVAEVHSSVCALLLMDLDTQGILPAKPKYTFWKKFENSDALRDDLWLLSYEAGVRGWGGFTSSHIAADAYFSVLMKSSVRFYDEKRVLPPLFHVKQSALLANNIQNESEFFDLDIEDFDDMVLHEPGDIGYEGIGYPDEDESDDPQDAPSFPDELDDNPF